MLGITATRAGAQADKVKEKPQLYRYVSYWAFPRRHWADVDKDNATGNQKILAPALADGTIVEYEIDQELIHTADSRAQLHFSFVMPSAEGLDKFGAALGAALDDGQLHAATWLCTGQRNLQVSRTPSGRFAGTARY